MWPFKRKPEPTVWLSHQDTVISRLEDRLTELRFSNERWCFVIEQLERDNNGLHGKVDTQKITITQLTEQLADLRFRNAVLLNIVEGE